MSATKVTWHRHYAPDVVRHLASIGSLDVTETDVFLFPKDDGVEAAAKIALIENRADSEMFVRGGRITILRPPHLAGDYEISVDWSPEFYAVKRETPA